MPKTLMPNASFPDIAVSTLADGEVKVGHPNKQRGDWQLVVVYRGKQRVSDLLCNWDLVHAS